MSADPAIQFETESEAETVALGERLARLLRAGDVVALEGELGAGKTRFVRGMARGLGCDERLVSSPTYLIAHEYSGGPGRPSLVHVDAYRLRSGDELEGLGLEDAMRDGALVVEWASRIEDRLDPGRLRVSIEHAGDDRRAISFSWDPEGHSWAERLASL